MVVSLLFVTHRASTWPPSDPGRSWRPDPTRWPRMSSSRWRTLYPRPASWPRPTHDMFQSNKVRRVSSFSKCLDAYFWSLGTNFIQSNGIKESKNLQFCWYRQFAISSTHCHTFKPKLWCMTIAFSISFKWYTIGIMFGPKCTWNHIKICYIKMFSIFESRRSLRNMRNIFYTCKELRLDLPAEKLVSAVFFSNNFTSCCHSCLLHTAIFSTAASWEVLTSVFLS